MIFQRAKPPQPPAERRERLDPLAEHDRLLPAGGHFFQIGRQPFELRAFAGGGVEVADLLQPQNQLEDMLDRGRLAHLGQPQHAFVLGQLVGVPLLGREFQIGVAK